MSILGKGLTEELDDITPTEEAEYSLILLGWKRHFV